MSKHIKAKHPSIQAPKAKQTHTIFDFDEKGNSTIIDEKKEQEPHQKINEVEDKEDKNDDYKPGYID